MALRTFDYGTLATLGLAIVGGIFWLGNINGKVESFDVQEIGRIEGRVSALEQDTIDTKDLGRLEGRVATLERDSISSLEIGKLDGRLTAIEKDKDYQSFRAEKEEAFEELEAIRVSSLNEINSVEKSANNTISTAEKNAINAVNANKKFAQKACRVVDSARNGGKLMCKVGEYVAGAQNLHNKNNVLDLIICCSP